MKNKLFSFFLLAVLSNNFINVKASQLSPRSTQHLDTSKSVFNFSDDLLEGQVEVSSSQPGINNLPLLTTIADILDLQAQEFAQEESENKREHLLQLFQENVAITNVSGLFDAFNHLSDLENQMLVHKIWGMDNYYDSEEIKSLKNVLKKALKNGINSLEEKVNYLESFIQVPQELGQAASSTDITGAMLQFNQLQLDEPTLPVLNEEDEEAFLRHQFSTETIVPSDFMQEIAAVDQEQLCQACNEDSTTWFEHSCFRQKFLFNQSSSSN